MIYISVKDTTFREFGHSIMKKLAMLQKDEMAFYKGEVMLHRTEGSPLFPFSPALANTLVRNHPAFSNYRHSKMMEFWAYYCGSVYDIYLARAKARMQQQVD